jgi:CHASE2 domain-containing sensor protein
MSRLVPLAMVLIVVFGAWRVAGAIETPVQDTLVRLTAKPVQDSPVVLVLIDDASLRRLKQRFGPLPWHREDYLAIFKTLSAYEPAALVFDGHFSEYFTPAVAEPLAAESKQSRAGLV